jgi:hypothetical protein
MFARSNWPLRVHENLIVAEQHSNSHFATVGHHSGCPRSRSNPGTPKRSAWLEPPSISAVNFHLEQPAHQNVQLPAVLIALPCQWLVGFVPAEP